MTELRYDEDATRHLLAVYMTPDVATQRQQFLHALNPKTGESVLDVGSCPGFFAAWEEHAADPFLPRTLQDKLKHAGFHVESQEVVPLFNPRYDPNTYSNRLIDLIMPFVTGRAGIDRDEAESWAHDLRKAGQDEQYFFSLNRYLFIARKYS